MKVLDFGVGGGRIVVAKGLFIANLTPTKFYPKRRSLMKEKKRKKIGIVLIVIIVLCIIGIIASPSDDKKDDGNPKQPEQQNTETTEQASETTEPKPEEKDEPAEIDGVEYILVTAGAPGTGNPHIDDAVKLYNRLGESSSVLYGK